MEGVTQQIVIYVRNKLFTPLHVIRIFALLLLICMVVYPVWNILYYTLIWHVGDNRINTNAMPGRWTFFHWGHVLFSDISRMIFYTPLIHSLSIALTVSVLSLVLGGGLAWLVTRSDIPGKRWIALLVVIPYMIPSWIKSIAWLIVFKNDRIGGSHGLLEYLLGKAPPDLLSYGYFPISLILTEHSYLYFYLLIAVALNSMNSQMEEAADIMGASRFTVLRSITFPIILPTVLSGFILTFSNCMGSFGVADVMGLPVRYYTLATMLYDSMNTGMTSSAYVLSVILILISAVIIFFNQKVIGKRRSFATIEGKDARKTFTPLGRWRIPSVFAAILFLLVSGLFPLVLLIWQSFMLHPGNYDLSNFTLHYWVGPSNPHIANGLVGVLRSEHIWMALKNSYEIAVVAAIVSSLLGLILGYAIVNGRKSFLSKAVEQFSFLPYLIPGIALAGVYLVMFSRPHLFFPALYGTLTILILISVIHELPFSVRSGTSTMFQISGELEEAATIQGASWYRKLIRIFIPIGRRGLVGSFLISFISAMKEMNLIIMLVTPSTNTLTTLTFKYTDTGYIQYSAAMVLIIIALILLTYFAAVKYGKADLSKGLGG